MSAAAVLKMIKDKGVKFVDFRFTTPGQGAACLRSPSSGRSLDLRRGQDVRRFIDRRLERHQ